MSCKKSSNMKDKKAEIWGNWVIFALSLVVVAISMAPFCRIGFTAADDLEYYYSFLRGKTWEDACNYAAYQGRFFFFITKPLNSLPFIFDNFHITKVFHIGALLFSYVSFAFLMRKILFSKDLAIALFVVVLAFTPVTSSMHIPFTAYTLYFCFSFGLLCWAIFAFLKYTETKQYKYVIISTVIFAIVLLFYETYLLYLVFFAIYVLIRNWNIHGFKQMWKEKRFWREIVPYMSIGVLYLAVYFFYRMTVSAGYSGTAFASSFSLYKCLRLMWRCTVSMFPLHLQYFDVAMDNAQALVGHYNTRFFMLTHAPMVVYVNATLVLLVLALLMRRAENAVAWRRVVLVAVGALLFAFGSHLVIGLSEKYNAEWNDWIIGYVTSYFSYFGVMTAIVLSAYAFVKLFYNRRKLYVAACVLVLAILAPMLIITGYSNDLLSHEWQRVRYTHAAMDELVKENAFSVLSDNDILYCPTLSESGKWGVSVFGDERIEWSDYLEIKVGKHTKGCRRPYKLAEFMAQDSTARVFYICRKEDKTHNELLLTLCEVDRATVDLSSPYPMRHAQCSQLDCYYLSPSKQFTLWVESMGADTLPAVLNGKDTFSLKPGGNAVQVRYPYWQRNHKSPLSILHIEGQGLAADGTSVSNVWNTADTVYTVAVPKN